MSQQQKSPHEDFIMTFFVCFLVGGICWIIWYVFSAQLTDFVRWVRVIEFDIVELIYGKKELVPFPGAGPQEVGRWKEWMANVPVNQISLIEMKVATNTALMPLRMFFAVLIGAMGLVCMFKGPGTRFRRRMGLETLMREQARSFPIISPFLKFNPCKLPPRVQGQPVPSVLPLFAEALTPEEWMAYRSVRMIGGQVDAAAAHGGLMEQLGKRWQGALRLKPHAQGLFAAFALRHVRKRKECEALLNELALSWSAEKGFRPSSGLMRKIRKIIRDPKIGGALQKHSDKHAWETTALLRALSQARSEGGVLSPSQFVWLRGHDRTLWYPLQNLGRKSYHAEAAGALVHYTNELIAGQKIPSPRFDDVIRGIESYMKSGAAREIPELDQKASGFQKYWKKR